MTDMYADTESRMRNDSMFRGVVMQLVQAARSFGFTPGELRQIAFAAAMEIERTRPAPVWHTKAGTFAVVECPKCGAPARFHRTGSDKGDIVCDACEVRHLKGQLDLEKY